MNTVEIIFSPTGGTKKVAEIITEKWNLNTQKIDLSNPQTDYSRYEIKEDDIALIAMPVFGSRPPAIAIERLKQLEGNGAKCVIVCVYGNGAYENTLSEMKNAAAESGFQVTSAIAAIAQHSIIPEYANGRPDEYDLKQLQDFAEQVKSKEDTIASNLKHHTQQETENTESKPVPPSEPPLPKPSETCTKCGICQKTCPVEAISGEENTSDVEKCIFCMRCVSQCPNQSREVDEKVISMAALSLKDMCSVRKENELFL